MIARIIHWACHRSGLVLCLGLIVCLGGAYAARTLPLDAFPELSDTQVIVVTEYPGHSPQVVEDQISYPLSTALLSVPRTKAVRGVSYFGVSFIHVIFDDGVDIYWARSRLIEYLSTATKLLPAGIQPTLGPDASGAGWVYQYALLSARHTLAELRTLQDWHLRPALARADGVSEAVSIGGYVKQYAVVLDPGRMRAFDLTLPQVREALRRSNGEVGGRTIELAETEYMVRGRGYFRGTDDIEQIVLKAANGSPVLLRDVARVEIAPEERRGVAELNGQGQAVSGIAIQRFGQNTLSVIESVKSQIARFAQGLPESVSLIEVYDRSELIRQAVGTLQQILIEESLVVALVCLIFLCSVRSALIVVATLPVAVLATLIAMKCFGLPAHVTSLGGIAIAIGVMIDAAVVMVENAHKHIERSVQGAPRGSALMAAMTEVGPAIFGSLVIITVSFIPVFVLEGQEGRMFKPLAFTKTIAMAAAALMALTFVPASIVLFLKGRVVSEERNLANRILRRGYAAILQLALRWPWTMVGLGALVMTSGLWPLLRLGSEFMPAFNEGTLLFMPTSQPGLSLTKAGELLQTQNKIIKSFPEVATAWGKAGRAPTATDPAPPEMFEITITLKPKASWRPGVTLDSLIQEMDAALTFPGVANAWTMPISGRADMLSTGIRTPVGVKITGPTLNSIDAIARSVEAAVRRIPGATSAYAERLNGGFYLDIAPDRRQLARYGLTLADLQQVISGAIGSETVTTVVEGRERYNVGLRYPRDMRSDPEAIRRDVLVPLANGSSVPLGQLATVKVERGPALVRTENAQLAAYVLIDVHGRDLVGFVEEARSLVAQAVSLPTGHTITWSGQFEHYERAKERLLLVVPATLALIAMLLYLMFGRSREMIIVLSSLPIALSGGLWMTWLYGFNLSVAVVIGFISLAGVAAQTGILMLLYIDQALTERRSCAAAMPLNHTRTFQAIMSGAVDRIRPKIMTVAAIIGGLLPILWSEGAGADMLQRIAVPMIGGMLSSALLTLLVIPAICMIIEARPHEDTEGKAERGISAAVS